ncbi:MAG: hypothetical protein AABW65_03555 [Nanoarchaeota archaeon]
MPKIEVQISKKRMMILLSALLLFSGVFAVWAFNANFNTIPKTVTDAETKMGHSADELVVDTAATVDCTKVTLSKMTLNEAIACKKIGREVLIGWISVPSGAIQSTSGTYVYWSDGLDYRPSKVCRDAGYDDYTGACRSTYQGSIEVYEGTFLGNQLGPGGSWSWSCQFGAGQYQMTPESTSQIQCIKGVKGAVSGASTPTPGLYKGALGCGGGVMTQNYCYPLACKDGSGNLRFLDCNTGACTEINSPPLKQCLNLPAL